MIDVYNAMTEWFQRLGRHPTCAVCGTNEWRVDALIGPPVVVEAPSGQVTAIDGTVHPFVPLVCKKCAHVLYFSWKSVKRDLGRG